MFFSTQSRLNVIVRGKNIYMVTTILLKKITKGKKKYNQKFSNFFQFTFIALLTFVFSLNTKKSFPLGTKKKIIILCCVKLSVMFETNFK